MKIVIISNLFRPHILGGYELLCGHVCDELVRRGHDVRVLTTGEGDTPHPETDRALSDVSRTLELSRPFDEPSGRDRVRRWRVGRRNERRTQEYLQRHEPDLVFLWSQLRLTVGPARAAERSGRPVVYTFNDENISSYLPASGDTTVRQRVGAAVDRWVLPDITVADLRFPHVTCISHRVKQNLMAQGLPLDHARIIRQGIPIEHFPLKSNPGRLSTPLRVLYTGQLQPYKGVHTLVAAAHRLASRLGPESVSVTIVGGGPRSYVSELEHQAAQGPASVVLAGHRAHAEIPQLYRQHDVFVFPSLWQEPFGLTHLEAMASGTPVVSTFDGGHGEFLVDHENALLFEKGHSEELAACLMNLTTHPDLASRLARTARAMVDERFTLHRYLDSLERLLHQAADGARSEQVAA